MCTNATWTIKLHTSKHQEQKLSFNEIAPRYSKIQQQHRVQRFDRRRRRNEWRRSIHFPRWIVHRSNLVEEQANFGFHVQGTPRIRLERREVPHKWRSNRSTKYYISLLFTRLYKSSQNNYTSDNNFIVVTAGDCFHAWKSLLGWMLRVAANRVRSPTLEFANFISYENVISYILRHCKSQS